MSQASLNAATLQATNWLHTNGGYEQLRYYPGNQINIDIVKHISPTCSAAAGGGTTGTAGSGTKGSKKKSGGATSTPKGF